MLSAYSRGELYINKIHVFYNVDSVKEYGYEALSVHYTRVTRKFFTAPSPPLYLPIRNVALIESSRMGALVPLRLHAYNGYQVTPMSNFSIRWPVALKRDRHRSRRWLILAIVLMVTMTTGFIVWPVSPPILDLRHPRSANIVSLMDHWRQGDLVVLVRHGERCDRSSHECLGLADGITRLGSEESQQLGRSFAQWGLESTDIMHSPITRTVQTARFMFDTRSVSQQWLADCGKTMRDDVLSHKQARRNLILVTHSGCISDFEKQTGFKHAAMSEYDSSLFVQVMPDGKLNVLGTANIPDWPAIPSVGLNP